jgi:hypothetical protein
VAVMKILGGCVLFLVVGTTWVTVGAVVAREFFEIWYPLGWIFGTGYIILSVAAIAKWELYRILRNHYIIVHLSVTEEQRQALLEQAIAGGYSDLDKYVADLLEPEMKKRLAEMRQDKQIAQERIESQGLGGKFT